MTHRARTMMVVALVLAVLPLVALPPHVSAVPNPVATDEASYAAFGRVFPDPQGCLNEVGGGLPKGVSPWAKGNVCATHFLSYEEVIEGSRFLARHLEDQGFDFLEVIRLEGAASAGIPRTVAMEDGRVRVFGRDRRPLYLFKVTDASSPVPERQRQHFVYALSIHGIERAGLEGGIRAMEDLVTWGACQEDAAAAPVCSAEGVSPDSPKPIVETPTELPVPTAGEVLDNAVVYFVLSNPDGWARGQVAPVEFEEGQPNAGYQPGVFYQRYNGNGVDLNRDWPAIGYTFKPYSPFSEPESREFGTALRQVRDEVLGGEPFAGGIDLHGMLTAYAFSYTLLGAGQRDFRKNALSVETAIRAWEDQTQRLSWSPYVADADADAQPDLPCIPDPVFTGTRGHVPACVADEWGTVIDTIGYQVTGAMGDWIDSPIGLDAVGIDNEMYMSHLTPNTVFEPALEQTHVDGNKGLIYSQIAALLSARQPTFEPGGAVGYVYNPNRLQVSGQDRPRNPGLPPQDDIEVVLPCQNDVQPQLEPAGCKGAGRFVMDGSNPTFEFDVQGPRDGVWNGGITATVTRPNALGISDGHLDAQDIFEDDDPDREDGTEANDLAAHIQLQVLDEGQWQPVAMDFNQSPIYLQAGQIVTANDPIPGTWRVWFERIQQVPSRLEIDFDPAEAEADPGQVPIDASSMDFFDELNRYVPEGQEVQAIDVAQVVGEPAALEGFDTIVLVNNIGSLPYLRRQLGLSTAEVRAFFRNLRRWTTGGGNLVLTDAALRAVPLLTPHIRPRDVLGDRWRAGSYHFDIGDTITYEDPQTYPLAEDVDKPGAAEQEPGRRQAAEPTPLGYTPDEFYDLDPMMPFWGVDRAAWEGACRTTNCVTALSDPLDDEPGNQSGPQGVSLGEMRLGRGVVRIAGIMFPDPVFEPDEANDHRFGVADYALTYTAYEVFENLIDYRRS